MSTYLERLKNSWMYNDFWPKIGDEYDGKTYSLENDIREFAINTFKEKYLTSTTGITMSTYLERLNKAYCKTTKAFKTSCVPEYYDYDNDYSKECCLKRDTEQLVRDYFDCKLPSKKIFQMATVLEGKHKGATVCIACIFDDGNVIVDFGEGEGYKGELEYMHKNNLRFWRDVKSVTFKNGTVICEKV